jgi:hypothetical protein
MYESGSLPIGLGSALETQETDATLEPTVSAKWRSASWSLGIGTGEFSRHTWPRPAISTVFCHRHQSTVFRTVSESTKKRLTEVFETRRLVDG